MTLELFFTIFVLMVLLACLVGVTVNSAIQYYWKNAIEYEKELHQIRMREMQYNSGPAGNF